MAGPPNHGKVDAEVFLVPR